MSYWIAANILFTAITYLFDFISNIIVLVDYGRKYAKLRSAECDDFCEYSKKATAGVFWTMLSTLLLSHTCNALIFKFKFNSQDDPLRSAYFLPLVHLWRMVDVLWRTRSFEKLKAVRASKHMSGLFAILTTAIEGLPILIVQFTALHYFGHNSASMKVSIAASFLAAGYTAGSSTLTVANNAKTMKAKFGIGISSGLFIVLAALARSVTYSIMILYIPTHYYYLQAKSFHFKTQFHVIDVLGALFAVGSITGYWLYYWVLQHPKEVLKTGALLNLKRCLTCLVLGFMSGLAGPLYPMVSEAKDRGELGTFSFQVRLFILSVMNIGIDIVVVSTSYKLGALPSAYIIIAISAGAGFGNLVFLAAYITIDIQSGPVRLDSSNSEVFYDPEQSDDSRYFDALSTSLRE